jgi:hypothetical protein
MQSIRRLAFLALVATTAVVVQADVPKKVAKRLDRVISPTEPGEFSGSYTLHATTVVQHPNGNQREEVVFETEVDIAPDGSRTRRLLRYIENGEDVTEEQRSAFESAERPTQEQSDDDSDLANPFGETAHLYRYGEAERVDGEMIASFEPSPGHEDDANVAAGRLAWNAETLEPTWLEMTAVHAPKPLKRLEIRIEFATRDKQTYVSRMVTEGLAKVLMIQREFHTDLRFEDIQPSASARP